MGILSAVVAVGVGGLADRGSDASCQASLDAARTAAQVHLGLTGTAPATFTDLTNSGSLTLPQGVTVAPDGRSLLGSGWSLGMNATQPTFTCTRGSSQATRYAAAVLADSPIAYWKLDETSGTTAADAGAAGATGSRPAGLGSSAGAMDGSTAALFNGVSGVSLISVPVAAGSVLDLSAAFSVEAWIRPTAVNQNGGIAEKTRAGGVNTQFLLFLENGFLSWRLMGSGFGGLTLNPVRPAINTWSHVVGTFDGTTARLYLDGQQVAAQAIGSGSVFSGSGPLLIGHLGTGVYSFTGAIDDVAVYGSALPASRVLAHFEAGRS